MLVLGLLLIVLGALAVLAAFVSTSGTASYLGAHLSAQTIFLLGVAAGLAVLLGLSLSRHGARRSLQARRDRRELQRIAARQGDAGPTAPPAED